MCYNPIYAQQVFEVNDFTGEIKKKMIFNNFNPKLELIPLACGKCYECLAAKSIEWSYRLMNEAEKSPKNCFLTLTYKDNPVNVSKRDFQLFIKRLRKKIYPEKIRYFGCGEYGSKGQRPHYHIIIFGWCPPDLKYFTYTKKHSHLYRSKIIEELWPFGFSSVGFVTEDTCKYTSEYMQKLNQIKGLEPPFLLMSSHPGIGYDYIIKNQDLLQGDKLYFKGNYIKLPRYYNDVLARVDVLNNSIIEENVKKREKRAVICQRDTKAIVAKKEKIEQKVLGKGLVVL